MTKAAFIALAATALAASLSSCAQLDPYLLDTKTRVDSITAGETNVVAEVNTVTNAIPVGVTTVTNSVPEYAANGELMAIRTVVSSVTNFTYSVVTTTNLVTLVTPPTTNYVVDVSMKKSLETGLDIAQLAPWPIVGQVASILGLVLQGVVASRRKALNKALVVGIEKHRNELKGSGSTQTDTNLVSILKDAQEVFNVVNEAKDLLVSQGFSKKNGKTT